ncbi:MAG: DUF2779 domain-containing protein [Bacilli bacterium]|nr:DUF2779 domain-containing protein [Bacilli bacterium]
MNLSKSKYCNGLQCKKMLWLNKYKPEVISDTDNESILEQGNAIHEVARYLFGSHINIEYTENLKEMIKDTYRTIDSYKDVVITEASFNYEGNFCSVDILVKKNDRYEIYEVKSSTKLKDVYINDASYQYYVLTSLGLKVTKVSIVVINSGYERVGQIILDELFKENDITSDVINLQPKVKSTIEEINKYLELEREPKKELSDDCLEPYLCPFFEYCTKDLTHPSVFDISVDPSKTAMKFYNEGYHTYKELLNAKINDKQRQTIEYTLYNKPDYIDSVAIKKFLDSLTYPLYYLDFETYQMPIPLFDYVHPYEQIPFQYSLHYELTDGGTIEHKEFLGTPGTDPRRELAEQLVHDIPMNSTTIAYHMSFEQGRIKRLAELYPDLSKHLMNIHDNIVDLEVPFKNRDYYTKEMGPSSSIKKVLPALFPDDPKLDYHNLDLIQNGSDAMNSFRAMENMTKEELAYTRERLLKYCELDTYAMVKILSKLKEVVK